MKLLEQKTLSKDSTLLERKKSERVRLNHATTTYQQPKYIHHHPSPPTTSQNILTITHYHQPPAKVYPPPPTTSQNTSTTTYNFPKNGPPPRKSQNIFIYISFWHCCNSFFFLEMKYSFPWWRFCVTKFWSVCFSSSKFLLTFRSSHRRCSVRIGVLRKFAIHRKTPVPESLF